MSLIKVGKKLFYESVDGHCLNRKCVEGPGNGITTDCEAQNGILRFCPFCGSKLKITRRRKRISAR